MKLVECVPNFSEGRDKSKIEEIAKAIESVEGVKLLDIDPGAATNRTVFTFVGEPDKVEEAAFRAIKKASEIIDMREHKGEHPRLGATDVVPFVPLSGVTMEDCVEIAKRLGKRVGEELKIPVYLYEEAASSPERKSLSYIRKGEYESLPEKLEKLPPDFGPSQYNEDIAKTGATIIGAREFLIAYNVNLNTKDKKLAHEIALNIRENGRLKRDENGKIVRDENGKALRVPGTLKAVRAIGWYIDEYGIAQISINLLNYKITPLWKVYEEVRKFAEKMGLLVTGSEIVGLVPKEAIVETGKYYLLKQKKTVGIPEKEIVDIAIKSLGLSSVSPFEPEEKIIEYIIEKDKKSSLLVERKLNDFIDEVSKDSPAPGGGSVSALMGSLSSALSSMVCALTHNKKGYEDVWGETVTLGERAQKIKDSLRNLVDEDTNAFNLLMKAMKLPKKTDEEKKIRKQEMEKAAKYAAEIPLKVMKEALSALELSRRVAEIGNVNSISDVGVAGWSARAAVEGAFLNVKINLSAIEDKEFKDKIHREALEILERARKVSQEVSITVLKRMEEED